MDLELSDDQFALRDNIRSVLEGACPLSLVRSVYEDGASTDELWAQMVELYWPALGVPEAFDGLGFGFVEVALLAEELGRAAAPGPLLAVVTQFVPLLVEAEAEEELRAAAAGESVGALALMENGRWAIDGLTTTAVASDGGWSITGAKESVVGGAYADRFAVIATTADGVGAFLVAAGDAQVDVVDHLDPGLGVADVSFDAAAASALIAPGSATVESIGRATDQAAVAMALHVVGACRRIFELTLDYAKVREQYDQVIGAFQALKHRFAELYLAVERANAIGYYAALAIAEDDAARPEAVHVAKAAAGECQRLVVEDGLQLHGGIGYTWENDLHFLLKRAKVGDFLCGTQAEHRARLAEQLGLLEVVS